MKIDILSSNTYLAVDEKIKLHAFTAKERFSSIATYPQAIQWIVNWVLCHLLASHVSYSVEGLQDRLFFIQKKEFTNTLGIPEEIELNSKNVNQLAEIFFGSAVFESTSGLDIKKTDLLNDTYFKSLINKINNIFSIKSPKDEFTPEQQIQIITSENPYRIIAKIIAPGDPTFLNLINGSWIPSDFLSQYLKSKFNN